MSVATFLDSRERRVGVRVVGLEADLVHADEVAVPEPDLVVEDAAEDALVQVARRRVRQRGPEAVVAALGPELVGPLEHVRHPADLTLAVGDAQLGEALERAGEDEVEHRAHRVRERQRARHDERRVGRRRRHPRARPDVHADDGARSPRTRRTSGPRRGPSGSTADRAGAGSPRRRWRGCPSPAQRRTSAAREARGPTAGRSSAGCSRPLPSPAHHSSIIQSL